jgi:hypothetical protein
VDVIGGQRTSHANKVTQLQLTAWHPGELLLTRTDLQLYTCFVLTAVSFHIPLIYLVLQSLIVSFLSLDKGSPCRSPLPMLQVPLRESPNNNMASTKAVILVSELELIFSFRL